MSDTELRTTLNKLDLQLLRDTQRRYGRLNLPDAFRRDWREKYDLAKQLLDDERRGLAVRKLARFLKDVTFSLSTLQSGERPNYYQYTDAHLLDWYLEPELADIATLKRRTVIGFFHLLRDLLAFEANSVGGIEESQKESLDRPLVHKRMDVIEEGINLCRELGPTLGLDPKVWDLETAHYAAIANYVHEPTRLSGLLHFSCFPLTQKHDEVIFIRVLHCSELCFFGIRLTLMAAIEAVKADYSKGAHAELTAAVEFSKLLHGLLKLLRTMPIEHFAEFRDYTGKASAIQSMAYHTMEIYLHGVNAAKEAHFRRVPHLSVLLKYRQIVSLRVALSMRKETDSQWSDVFSAARLLDRKLLTWRGLHLSFAKLYIPQSAPGTGGTSGATYLKQHLDVGLFDDTEGEVEIAKELFPNDVELMDYLRIPQTVRIAPEEPLRTKAVPESSE